MKPLVSKLKPARGVSTLLHVGLLLVFPVILFTLVRLENFTPLAFMLIALSKWRMFAVRPRFWPANIRANAVDIIVGLATIVFMLKTQSPGWQFIWALVYAAWLIFLKPGSSVSFTSIQAGVGFVMGLLAIHIAWGASPLIVLVSSVGLVCFLAARHFFDSFDEPYARLLSYIWGYFGAALMWVLGHLLIVYPREGFVAQPLLFLGVIGVGLAAAYYLDHYDKFAGLVKRQMLFMSSGVILLLLVSLYYEGSRLLIR